MTGHRRRISLLVIAAMQSAPMTAWAQGTAQSAPPRTGAPPAGQAAPPPTPAWLSPRMEEARTRYSRGLKLFDEGNAVAARVEFERAYELAPSYRILYNIGLCYKKTNDYVEALKAFERYLLDGGDEVAEDRRAAVNKEIQDLRPNIATVTVTTNVPGATVSVDDVPVGQTPFSHKVLVNPGRRRISATKPGMFPATKSLVFAGSDAELVTLELVDLPKTADTSHEKVLPPVPWVAWGITGALAVGAGVVGVLALKANSDQNDTVNRQGATRSEIDDAHSKTKTLSVVADVLTASAVVAGGISLYLTLHKTEKSSTTARLTPGGVSIVGQF